MVGSHKLFLGGALLLTAVACRESIGAPGSCPEYCPGEGVLLVDSVFLENINLDSTFVGFVATESAPIVQIGTGTDGIDTRALMRLAAFSDSVRVNPDDSTFSPVLGVDSLRLEMGVVRQSGRVTVDVYRLPLSIGSGSTYGNTDQFFDDSLLVGSFQLGDTTRTATLAMQTSDLPGFDSGETRTAFGFRVRAGDQGFVDLGVPTLAPLLDSPTLGVSSAIVRYYRADSSGVTVRRRDARSVQYSTTLVSGTIAIGANEMSVGGLPASRAILRVKDLEEVIGENSVSRATLELIPSRPIIGPVGDTIDVQAPPVIVDFGAKSLIDLVMDDTLRLQTSSVAAGSMDTVRVDITNTIRAWARSPDLPRALMIVSIPEGASRTEFRFGAASDASRAPRIRITMIPPVGVQGL